MTRFCTPNVVGCMEPLWTCLGLDILVRYVLACCPAIPEEVLWWVLWLTFWATVQPSEKAQTDLPFQGNGLFSATLVNIIQDLTGGKSVFLPPGQEGVGIASRAWAFLYCKLLTFPSCSSGTGSMPVDRAACSFTALRSAPPISA